MDKVTIEITKDYHEVTVNINGKEFKQKDIRVRNQFRAERVEGDFEEEEEISDKLYDALDSFFCFNVMLALDDDCYCDDEEE